MVSTHTKSCLTKQKEYVILFDSCSLALALKICCLRFLSQIFCQQYNTDMYNFLSCSWNVDQMSESLLTHLVYISRKWWLEYVQEYKYLPDSLFYWHAGMILGIKLSHLIYLFKILVLSIDVVSFFWNWQ